MRINTTEQKIIQLNEKIAVRFLLNDPEFQLSENKIFLEIISHTILIRMGYDYKIQDGQWIIVYNVKPLDIDFIVSLIQIQI